jgi:hypothetical protein
MAYGTCRFPFRTIASNRSHVMALPSTLHIEIMTTQHQFMVISDSPAKHERFMQLKQQHGDASVFLYQ